MTRDDGQPGRFASKVRWDTARGRINRALDELSVGEGIDVDRFDAFAADVLTKLAAEYQLSADTAGAIRTEADQRAHAAAVEEAACDTADAFVTDADQQPDDVVVEELVAKLQQGGKP